MNKDVLPLQSDLSKDCKFEIYKKGGHLGFIEGNIFKPKYMLEKRVLEYFNEYF